MFQACIYMEQDHFPSLVISAKTLTEVLDTLDLFYDIKYSSIRLEEHGQPCLIKYPGLNWATI